MHYIRCSNYQMPKRYFTLEEAQSLIPTLELKLSRLLQIKKEMTEFLVQLHKRGVKVEDLLANPQNADEDSLELKQKLENLATKLNAQLADIQSHGCLVKDLDLGLIDFYYLIEDEEVFLCWQLGEKEIGCWHRITEGFSNRRPLFDQDWVKEEKEKYH